MSSGSFERDGFVVVPEALNARTLRALRRSLTTLCQHACDNSSADDDHDTVIPPEDSAAFQFEHSAAGKVITPLRVHKIQGVGLVCDEVRALIRSPYLTSVVTKLARESELDAFGTKFFPVRPGNCGSVGWHDDNYYFGTTRSRTISCVCYLADTDPGNGCLRVVPTSHRDAHVGPERGRLYRADKQRHGEYIPESLLEDTGSGALSTVVNGSKKRKRRREDVADVAVRAGTAVLFDANLLHCTWPNRSTHRASPRLAFHYIPTDHEGEFRGVSFARGKFADRHPTTVP